MHPPQLPYKRLSALYFWYFAMVGAFFPYWGLYLQTLGFDSRQIGELMAVFLSTSLLSPNIWGWLADHLGHRLFLIRIAGLLSIISFAGIYLDQQYAWVVLVTFALGFFWHAAMPLIESLTLSFLDKDTQGYGKIRLWASVSIAVLAAATGYFLENRPMSMLPDVILSILVIIFLVMLTIPHLPENHTHPHQIQESFIQNLKKPTVLFLLFICFMVFFSHGPFQAFSGIYFENAGYSRKAIGWVWTLGLASEVILLFWMSRLLTRWGLPKILWLGIFLHIPGWLLIAFQVEHLAWLLLGQLFVSLGYAACIGTAIGLIHQTFTGRLQGRGQALFLSFSVGGGLMSGALVSGYVWDIKAPHQVFVMAAGVTLLASLMAYFFMFKQKA